MDNSSVIYKYLKNTNIIQKRNNGSIGCTTLQIAQALNISRANVSTILNKLCNQGKVSKTNTRPVIYQCVFDINTQREISLDNFLTDYETNGVMITRAKAAMAHPPHGLNVCLVGEVGVGKLFFAKLMHNYGCEEGVLVEQAPFITIDCTRYLYNNSKLLYDLFGISKNSKTVNKDSLVFKANGGVIFLEEPHLLSSWFRNILFQFMRKGFITNYEKAYANISNVIFICASVGSKSNYYIRSFSDMFPISIELPPIRKINLSDKFSYINLFFQLEAERIKKQIQVDIDVMECFLLYNCIGNLAQLQRDIRTTCSFANFQKQQNTKLEITIDMLDSKVKQGLYNYKIFQSTVETIFDGKEEFIYNVGYSSSPLEYYITHNNSSIDDARFSELNLKRNITDNSFNDYEFTKFVSEDAVKITRLIINRAEAKLDTKYNKRIFFGLAMHINDVKNYSSITSNQSEENKYIMKRLKKEYEIIESTSKEIQELYNVKIPKSEFARIATYLSNQYDENLYSDLVPPIIVCMHGYSIASSIVETIKQLMYIENIHAHDMHLDKSSDIIYNELKQLIKNSNYKKGVLIISDLMSISNISDKISKELGIKIHLVGNASVPLAIEYAIRVDQFRDITKALSFIEKKQYKINKNKPNLIIAASYNENDTSKVIKEYLLKNLDEKYNIKVIAANLFNKQEFEALIRSYQNNYNVLVISNIENNFTFVKNLSYTKIQNSNDLREIYNYFTIHNDYSIHNSYDIYEDVLENLEKNYKSINFTNLSTLLPSFLKGLEEVYSVKIHYDIGIGLLCHICATIDAILNYTYSYNTKVESSSNNSELISKVKSLYIPIEKEFNIIFSDIEAIIVDNIMSEMRKESSNEKL